MNVVVTKTVPTEPLRYGVSRNPWIYKVELGAIGLLKKKKK